MKTEGFVSVERARGNTLKINNETETIYQTKTLQEKKLIGKYL